eukprot:Sdes_comp19225_c0_seq1m10124
MSSQFTLAILKPDIFAHPYRTKAILDWAQKCGFRIEAQRQVSWTIQEAQQFYREHQTRFFFPRLTSFMSSGPMLALVLKGEDAVVHWRQLLGPTRPSVLVLLLLLVSFPDF